MKRSGEVRARGAAQYSGATFAAYEYRRYQPGAVPTAFVARNLVRA